MLFIYYLKELKFRLIYIFLSFLFNFIILFNFVKDLLFLIISPLLAINKNFTYFIFTNMSDVLLVYLKIVFILSLILILPIIFLQVWFFLIEGLYIFEGYFLIFIYFIFLFLFYFINFLLYNYMIPFIWAFFINFELTSSNFLFGIYYEARITDYVNFMFNIFLIFSSLLIFPLLMIFFIYFKILKFYFFILYRKYFFILFFILAGLFSPPDIFSQFFIVIPIIFCYEFILIYFLFFYNYLK
jgi:sec-independent protein translocase protein TatC